MHQWMRLSMGVSCFFFSILSVSAVPNVTNTTGIFTEGGIITVQGNGFWSSGPNILIFDDFEKWLSWDTIRVWSGSAQLWQWDYLEWTLKPRYSNFSKVSGNLAFRADMSQNYLESVIKLTPFWTRKIYMSWWILIPEGTQIPGENNPDGTNWKNVWIQGAWSADDDIIVPTFFWVDNAIISWNNSPYHKWVTPSLRKGQWKRLSTWINAWYANDGQVHYWELTDSWLVAQAYDDNVSVLNSWWIFERIRINGYGREQLNSYPMFDDVYIATGDNARARVEIGNSSTYTSSTNLAVSTPSSWSDTSIQLQFRKGSFTPNQTAYLYVIDASGNVNTNGYPITIGASSSTDTTPPVVTLAGANPLSLVQGSSFTEPGASWTDTVDGSWNTFTGTYGSLGSFARSGSVNTSLPGTYTLQYRKVDRAGNATTLSRTVTVTAVSTTPFASGFCNTVNIPSTECLALEKLYQNTNGANWTTKNNWWTNTNVATWTGVTLSWGTVYTLRLINNNLSGPLTANGFTFSAFKNLYAIHFAGNFLTGNLPANTFSWLTEITSITFYSNQLSGTLPPNLFTWLSRVRYINFHTNQLSGVLPPTLLSGLTNLDTLYLNTNQFTGTLSSTFFSWLTKLNIISLYNNSLSWTFPTVPSSVTVGSIYNNAFNFSSFSNNFLSIVSRVYAPQKNITLKLRYVLDASDAGTLSGTTNTYTWYSSTGVIATTTNNPLLIVSDTGTYRVEVRNSLITNTNNSTTNLVISSKVLTF